MKQYATLVVLAACGMTLDVSRAEAAPSRTGAKQSSLHRPPAVNAARTAEARRPKPERAAARNPLSGIRLASLPGAGGRLTCVPYARMATGMAISGDGRMWWHNAAGLYQRGQRPEVGSVLAFPGSGGMRAGHVSVVESVGGPREITVHHANWTGPGIPPGTITRNIRVVDVSDGNDWTAVRVQAGYDGGTLGRPYPTYGFIHNRPTGEGRVILARAGAGEVAEATPHLRFMVDGPLTRVGATLGR